MGRAKFNPHAEVAQLVEHHLAMVRVAGSNPVFRSGRGPNGGMAEWLGKGLQNPAPRFDSGCRLSEGPRSVRHGRLAQGESAFLTRRRSVVRIHYRPPRRAGSSGPTGARTITP